MEKAGAGGGMESGSRFVVVSIVVLAVLVAWAVVRSPGPAGSPSFASDGVRPTATVDPITSVFQSPAALSLTWQQTGDLCFRNYTLQRSTVGSGGPWTTVAVIMTYTNTSQYVRGMTPGGMTWWQIVDYDCLGSVPSNPVQVVQPAVAALTYTRPTAASAQFAWTNDASYGGLLAFGSYQLMESINGGPFSPATTITVSTARTYTVQGLSPSTAYAFRVNTTDVCAGTGCGGGTYPSSTDSNTVTFTTPPPLAAQATASPTTTDVGVPVSFACAVSGGTPPYSITWAFGDGSGGTGRAANHTYASAGAVTATCTATDASGSTASSPVTVQVNPAPSGPFAFVYTPILGVPLWTVIALIVILVVVLVALAAIVRWVRRPPARRPPEAR